MLRSIIVVSLFLILITAFCSAPENNGTDFPELHGPYLGQMPPTDKPEIFGAGIISLGNHEHHLSIAPDNSELFFVIADKYRIHHVIVQVRRTNDLWQEPEVAPFSGTYSDFAPTYTPDGTSLLFCSNRPLPDDTTSTGDFNIWTVRKTAEGWGSPEPLPGKVNDGSQDYNPTMTSDGTLYFQDHDKNGADIYKSEPVNGVYGQPEKLSEAVNSRHTEIGPWVAPDESFLMFSSDRPGGRGYMDFYICFADGCGGWNDAVNMGDHINTPGSEAIVTMSPDAKYLFYVSFQGIDIQSLKGSTYRNIRKILGSPRNGEGTLFWVKADFIRELKTGIK